MKKILFVVSILVVSALALGIVAPALAAGSQQGGPRHGGSRPGQGNGFQADPPMYREISLDGSLEDLIHENLAASLGISISDLEGRVEDGETLMEIGISLGFSADAVWEMLDSARVEAYNQAVLDGILTEEDVDWLSSRGTRIGGYYGAGDCLGD